MELRDAAGHVDSPVGMVDESVMAAAECDTVFDAGGAVVGPVDNVVDIAPAGRDSNSRLDIRVLDSESSGLSDDH
jgi:hypothetical protein